MSAEPLARIKTEQLSVDVERTKPISDFSLCHAIVAVPGETEVEVWPAGDRPTREQLEALLYHVMQRHAPQPPRRPGPTDLTASGGWVDAVVEDILSPLWALLHGQGGDTDGSA